MDAGQRAIHLAVTCIVLLACLLGCRCASSATFNVMNYGASGNGRSYDTQAFLKAWEAACRGNNRGIIPTIIVPANRRFVLTPVKFQGPCHSSLIQVQIMGSILAPKNRNAWSGCQDNTWLFFSDVSGLIITGPGQIDGQGSSWWKSYSQTSKYSTHDADIEGMNGCSKPTTLHFYRCNGLRLKGLHLLNSPRNHISINACNNVFLSNLNIFAPEDSPNTDGVDISSSTQVHVNNSVISTGDDCVAINNGSSNIYVTSVNCGPGHGISVGSLGKDESYTTVEEIHVQNCRFRRTQNGVRIKTWQGGSGYAKNIYFEQITFQDVQNPIIIDQYYCNGQHNCKNETSAVKVSNVIYRNVHGTSASKTGAIKLECSNTFGCTGILMENVQITSSVSGQKVETLCNNAHGSSIHSQPHVSCLR